MTDRRLSVRHRPRAKLPWLIKRGPERIRLTYDELYCVIEEVRVTGLRIELAQGREISRHMGDIFTRLEATGITHSRVRMLNEDLSWVYDPHSQRMTDALCVLTAVAQAWFDYQEGLL